MLSRVMQGRPVNVKHDARCVMDKVGGEDKKPKKGGNLIYMNADNYIYMLVNRLKSKDKHIFRECALKIALTRSIFQP